MCGILGTINRPFDSSILDLIRHRGPDDYGISELRVGDHKVMMGHRRLSIVDVSLAGRQPMWTASRKHSIVFNGEIYNHSELREQMRGNDYRGHSDTETILNYLAERGITGAQDFNGIFAFAFLDEEKPALYLARDPFGVKPLYYWAGGASCVFSSELRPLRALLNEVIDMDSLAELLRLRYLPAPDTLFRNIRKVRPGHIIEVGLQKPELYVQEYAFTKPPRGSTMRMTREEAVTRYGELVTGAVERQLMSDVPIGVLLSGGVDSALIASIAQRKSGYRMKAFTVGFANPDECDEIADARETARFVDMEHHHVRMGVPDFLMLMPKISSIVEEPLATTSIVPMFHLSRLAAEHVKVVLSGQGADEALGGYRRYQTELLRSFIPNAALALLPKRPSGLNVRNDTLRRMIGSIGIREDVARFEAVYSVFGKDQIHRLIGRDCNRAHDRIQYTYDYLGCAGRRHSVERMMSIDLRMNLADDLLLYTDKITMHHSLECRVPLLDLQIINFVESLPAAYRLGVMRGKMLHKKFAERVLPPSIVRRKKKGFLSPTKHWFKQPGPIWEILLDPQSRFASYFDVSEVRKILLEHQAGLNRERHIFLLLNLHYWMAESFESQAHAA